MSTTIKTRLYHDDNSNETITITITLNNGKPVGYELPEGWSIYPMDITSDNDFDYNYDPDFISFPLVGSKRRRSLMIPMKEDKCRVCLNMDKAEDKREERKAIRDNIISTEDVDEDEEYRYSQNTDATHDEAMSEIDTELFPDFLRAHQPDGCRLPEIFDLLAQGYQPKEIAEMLNVKSIYYKIQMIQDLWKQYCGE